MPAEARKLIEKLGMIPHPEGGWYKETWRDLPGENARARARATAILFLLEQGQRSDWHKVDAAELWFWHAGHPLWLGQSATDHGPVIASTLGPDVLAGHAPQVLIPAHHWQATEARTGWGLVSCVVVPGFDFAGFTLAHPGWEPSLG